MTVFFKKSYKNIGTNVSLSQPKIRLRNHPVMIKGVYPNVFRIEEKTGDTSACHTVQYAEVLMKRVEIVERMQQVQPPGCTCFSFDSRLQFFVY